MEELNKNQLILLALLVSFVTSIAASIATASLLDQAPPKVTQTIHRVVERTVETVIPAETIGDPTGVSQEKTVIVREEDAITDAIAKISPSLVRIYVTDDNVQSVENVQAPPRFRGIAVAVDGTGGLVTTSADVLNEPFNVYDAVLADGTVTTAVVQERRTGVGATFFSLVVPSGVQQPIKALFGDDSGFRLGQTLLGLGGNKTTSVGIGIVSNISRDEDGKVSEVEASVLSDVPGMPYVNLFGEIVGMSKSAGVNTFLPSGRVIAQSAI